MCQCSPGTINGGKLSKDDVSYIRSLGLLEEGEEIKTFSSSLNIRTSGNFFTNKRIASYWQFEKSPRNNYIKSAKYDEIKTIKVEYGDNLELSHSLIVNLKDGTSFNVYFDCNIKEIEEISVEVTKFIN
jgi:hypothetical protein